MIDRLNELDLLDRRARAEVEGWKCEIEGLELTLQCLRDKRTEMLRLSRTTSTVGLGMPGKNEETRP